MGDDNINIRPHNLKLIVSLFLIIITLAVFWQVRNHEFINFDDDDYVTQNRLSEAVRIKPDFSEAMHYLKRALEEAGQLE
ncbi:MAG: hypothetical protein JRE24_01205 [Deltaproteobacteria bacterium]|nr:hypothetical protein [Deltaproteobacteria bacterium]